MDSSPSSTSPQPPKSPPGSSAQPAPSGSASATGGGKLPRLHLEEWSLVVLAVLSLVGFGLADFSAQRSFRYWLYIAPLFAIVSIFMGWARAREHGDSVGDILKVQILHWLALPVVVYVIYLLHQTGRVAREDAGLMALISIALTTFLAGVHFDWRLGVLGLALAAGALAAALVDEFFWVFLIVGILLGAVAWWRRRPAA